MASNSGFVQRLRALSSKLSSLEIVVAACARELESLIELEWDGRGYSFRSPKDSPEQFRVGRYLVNCATFSVSDGPQICYLGNTVSFRFFECLARESNRLFTRDQLQEVVWDGARRATTTIRSAVFGLRSQLRNAGMTELADALRAEGRAYSLKLDE